MIHVLGAGVNWTMITRHSIDLCATFPGKESQLVRIVIVNRREGA
jgi:uncharacterized membrane protein YuzA (DUF378 family)